MMALKTIKSNVNPIIWKDNKILVLDQRLLPYEKKYIELTSYKEVISAIKDMAVRGAPLIGITAAYGMALAACEFTDVRKLKDIGEEIKKSRPTAINLNWAVNLILSDINELKNKSEIINAVTSRALWIHEDDAMRCQKIGEYGLEIVDHVIARKHEVLTKQSHNRNNVGEIASGLRPLAMTCSVLTICNTGALATGGIGTAFGIILTLHKTNKNIKVYASETRPRQQGARLTTYECIENGIDCILISDTACGYLMQKGEIDVVITGADRIALNGDTANKIGTYQLAVLAKENQIPFYIAAPLSTFDLSVENGSRIPIEERDENEIKIINGKPICKEEVKARNPAFDITPSKYITGIITEKGMLHGNYKKSIGQAFNEAVIV